jgi:2-amino-4-hydroxy-6-hydroxymethyldihydropteridine diphosphokinase
VDRVRTYIGLGANLGDARKTLTEAVRVLAALPGARLTGVSSLYVTRPVDVTEQPDFHNAVVALDAEAGSAGGGSRAGRSAVGGAIALLLDLKSIERGFGRQQRAVERPAEGRSADPGKADQLLVVPHPRARDRLFVLAPLADLAPDLVPPGWTETVARARERREAIEGSGAVRRVALWSPDRGEWV